MPRDGDVARRRARTRRGRARRPSPKRPATRSSTRTGSTRTGRADRPRLRPLRRAAGRPARPVDSPPFEPVVVGDRMLARGVGGRQGPDPPPRYGPRGAPGDAWQPAGQRALPVRGRGGVRLARTSTQWLRRTANASQRTWPSSATRLLRGQPAGDHGRPPRERVRPDRRRGLAGRPPFGDVRRGGPEPGQRARPDRRGAQGSGRADPHPGLLRRCRRPDRPGARGVRGPALRRRGLRGRIRASGRLSARPASPCSSGSARVRPSTSTASGAASRARAQRRSSRPTPTPR